MSRILLYLLFTSCLFSCNQRDQKINAYNIYDLGVAPNLTSVQTKAVQNAIDQVNANGGGTLIIPHSEIISGTIILKPNVSLYLSGNATLKGSGHLDDYSVVEKDKLVFIYGNGLKNISISGQGTIVGQGHLFWDEEFNALERPFPWVLFTQCENINIKDITFTNSPSHTLRVENSNLVSFDNVKIINPFQGPNTDGIDIVDTKNVFISNTYISTGDDAICLKSQRDTVENVIVTNTILESDDAAIKFGTGSRVATRFCKFDNITIRNTRYGVSLFMLDGGIFEHNTFSNITIETNSRHRHEYPIFIDIDKRLPDRPYGQIRNNTFSNITIHSGGKVMITGHPESSIVNMSLKDIRFYLHDKQDFSDAKKPRGNKNYPNLQTSVDLSQRPEHLVFAYVNDLDFKDISLFNGKSNQKMSADFFQQEVELNP